MSPRVVNDEKLETSNTAPSVLNEDMNCFAIISLKFSLMKTGMTNVPSCSAWRAASSASSAALEEKAGLFEVVLIPSVI